MTAEPKSEADLIRALAEDLALEILASYKPDDFADADFTSLGEAAVYLGQHEQGPGPRPSGAYHQGPKSGRDMTRCTPAEGKQPAERARGLGPEPCSEPAFIPVQRPGRCTDGLYSDTG